MRRWLESLAGGTAFLGCIALISPLVHPALTAAAIATAIALTCTHYLGVWQ